MGSEGRIGTGHEVGIFLMTISLISLISASMASSPIPEIKPNLPGPGPAPSSVLFSENFSTPWIPCGTGYDAPPGWTVDGICVGENAPYLTHYWSHFNDSQVGFDMSKSPPYSAGMWWNNGAGEPYGSDSDEWLMTPNYDMADYENLTLTFYSIYPYSTYGLPATTHFYVKASTDNGTTWDILGDLCHEQRFVFPSFPEDGPYNWNRWPIILNLTAYDHENSLIISWHKYSESMDTIWTVDDILIEGSLNPPPLEYDIPLEEGWNLISLPLVQSDYSLENILGLIDDQWDCVMQYDPLSPEPWKMNCTFKPDSLNDIDALDPERGFWINIIEPGGTNLPTTGYITNNTSISLFSGWNLVGYPSLRPLDIATALAGTGYDRPVEGFDGADPYHLTQLSGTYMMQPGEGYWIHVPADTIWVVDW